jgi:serine/threonine protein kinase
LLGRRFRLLGWQVVADRSLLKPVPLADDLSNQWFENRKHDRGDRPSSHSSLIPCQVEFIGALSRMPSDPNIGRILQNRYQLVGLLGQGAMGKVYEARNNLLGGVPVAVKFLSQTLLNQKMRDRFMREATTCALLGQRSMHIVNVTDYGVDEDEIPYYVMEYLKGDSLSEIIMRQPLPLPRFLNLTHQICLGLQCAHEGIPVDGEICPIVHRDIKPSNILITHAPGLGEMAKILDFGMLKRSKPTAIRPTVLWVRWPILRQSRWKGTS